MATVSVRYIVDDVDEAMSFYCEHLGFSEQLHPAPTFAMLQRGDLRLALSAPGGPGGGGQAMPDGSRPQPGGWNRFMVEVDDLDGSVAALRALTRRPGQTPGDRVAGELLYAGCPEPAGPPSTTAASSRRRGRARVVSRSSRTSGETARLSFHRDRPAMAPLAPLATAISTCRMNVS